MDTCLLQLRLLQFDIVTDYSNGYKSVRKVLFFKLFKQNFLQHFSVVRAKRAYLELMLVTMHIALDDRTKHTQRNRS